MTDVIDWHMYMHVSTHLHFIRLDVLTSFPTGLVKKLGLRPLIDTTCPGRGCSFLHMPAFLVTSAPGLACPLVADRMSAVLVLLV